jgi:hypothetical protein
MMNERIRELAESCTVDFVDGRGVSLSEIDVEKFAELLIRECSHIAKVNQLQSMNWDIGEILLEHFGVE